MSADNCDLHDDNDNSIIIFKCGCNNYLDLHLTVNYDDEYGVDTYCDHDTAYPDHRSTYILLPSPFLGASIILSL